MVKYKQMWHNTENNVADSLLLRN